MDTHLFLQFHYAPPLDLSAADCLALETWVPDGQATPSQVLVILHEEGGGDFLAETGRSLAAPGREAQGTRISASGWPEAPLGVSTLRSVASVGARSLRRTGRS